LQVFSWFQNCGSEAHPGPCSLSICRIKNKFALARSEVIGGYRDLMCCFVFQDQAGLKIICEIQIHDKILHDLKSRVCAVQLAVLWHICIFMQCGIRLSVFLCSVVIDLYICLSTSVLMSSFFLFRCTSCTKFRGQPMLAL
jgi:hypothetical protein